MPKNVNDKRASLEETHMQFIEKADDEHDYQWEVQDNETGNYKIFLNVIDMTVKFEKLP